MCRKARWIATHFLLRLFNQQRATFKLHDRGRRALGPSHRLSLVLVWYKRPASQVVPGQSWQRQTDYCGHLDRAHRRAQPPRRHFQLQLEEDDFFDNTTITEVESYRTNVTKVYYVYNVYNIGMMKIFDFVVQLLLFRNNYHMVVYIWQGPNTAGCSSVVDSLKSKVSPQSPSTITTLPSPLPISSSNSSSTMSWSLLLLLLRRRIKEVVAAITIRRPARRNPIDGQGTESILGSMLWIPQREV